MRHLMTSLLALAFYGQVFAFDSLEKSVDPITEVRSTYQDETTGEDVRVSGRGFWVFATYDDNMFLYLVTAGHLVGGANTEVFVESNGASYCNESAPCSRITDNMHDVAIFSVPLPELDPQSFNTSAKPVFTLNYEGENATKSMLVDYSNQWRRPDLDLVRRGYMVHFNAFEYLSPSLHEEEVHSRYLPGMSGTPILETDGSLKGMAIASSKHFHRSWLVPAKKIYAMIGEHLEATDSDRGEDPIQWSFNDGALYRHGKIPSQYEIYGVADESSENAVRHFVEANGPRHASGLNDRSNTGGRSDIGEGEFDDEDNGHALLGGRTIVALHLDCQGENDKHQDFFVPAGIEMFHFIKNFGLLEQEEGLRCTHRYLSNSRDLFRGWRNSLLRERDHKESRYHVELGGAYLLFGFNTDRQESYDIRLDLSSSSEVLIHLRTRYNTAYGISFSINEENILSPYVESLGNNQPARRGIGYFELSEGSRLEHQQLIFATANLNLNQTLDGFGQHLDLGEDRDKTNLNFHLYTQDYQYLFFAEYDRWSLR